MKKVDAAIDQIKHGVYRVLEKSYKVEKDGEEAGLLAAAVTNALFSLPPASEEGRAFLEAHAKQVEKRCLALKGDATILEPVNKALRVRQKLLFELLESGKTSGTKINAPMDNLKKRGLLVPVGTDFEYKPFIAYAARFFKSAGKA